MDVFLMARLLAKEDDLVVSNTRPPAQSGEMYVSADMKTFFVHKPGASIHMLHWMHPDILNACYFLVREKDWALLVRSYDIKPGGGLPGPGMRVCASGRQHCCCIPNTQETGLQYYSTTVLQYYSTTVLQYYSTTVLQYYSTTPPFLGNCTADVRPGEQRTAAVLYAPGVSGGQGSCVVDSILVPQGALSELTPAVPLDAYPLDFGGGV
jgi:hypothetical protein